MVLVRFRRFCGWSGIHTLTRCQGMKASSGEATALALFTWWWWYIWCSHTYVMRWLKKHQTYYIYIYMVRKHNLPKAVRTVWPSLLSDSCCCWCRSAIGIHVLLQCFEYIIYSVVCGGVFFLLLVLVQVLKKRELSNNSLRLWKIFAARLSPSCGSFYLLYGAAAMFLMKMQLREKFY